MIIRAILTCAAAFAAATPLNADTLPQGAFMLGSHVWPDAILPRYATVFIEGGEITLEMSSAVPLNAAECDTTGGCEVRGLAPLMARDDLTAGEAAFVQAMNGAVIVAEITVQMRALAPVLAEPSDISEEEQARAMLLRARTMLPTLLGFEQQGPDATDTFDTLWNGMAQGIWAGDRDRYDADIASYGDTLLPLASFLRHMRTIAGPITTQAACDDLSFGCIAAQEGG